MINFKTRLFSWACLVYDPQDTTLTECTSFGTHFNPLCSISLLISSQYSALFSLGSELTKVLSVSLSVKVSRHRGSAQYNLTPRTQIHAHIAQCSPVGYIAFHKHHKWLLKVYTILNCSDSSIHLHTSISFDVVISLLSNKISLVNVFSVNFLTLLISH